MDKSLDQSCQNGDYQKLETKYYQNLNELTALKQENNMLRFQIEDFNLKLRESDGDIRLIQEKIRKMKRNKIDSTVKRDSKAFSQNKESIRNSNQKRRTTKDFIDSKSKPATGNEERKDNQDNKKIIMEYEKKQAALEAQLEQKEEEIKSYKLKLNSQKKDKIISDALRIDEKDKQDEMINKLKGKIEELEKKQKKMEEDVNRKEEQIRNYRTKESEKDLDEVYNKRIKELEKKRNELENLIALKDEEIEKKEKEQKDKIKSHNEEEDKLKRKISELENENEKKNKELQSRINELQKEKEKNDKENKDTMNSNIE